MAEVNSGEDEKATALTLGSATLFESGARASALPSAIKPIAPGQQLAGRAFPVQAPPGRVGGQGASGHVLVLQHLEAHRPPEPLVGGRGDRVGGAGRCPRG